MLELQPKPQFNIVVPPKLLQEGYLVQFPSTWPSTYTSHRGKMFQLGPCLQIPYDLSYKLPAGDYRDVDFSNGDGTFQESVYPEQDMSLFEVLVGFKPGAFITEWFIPADKSLHRLEYAQMEPDITSAKKLYLGAFKPSDSPYEDPKIKLYFVRKLTPLIMRVYILPSAGYYQVGGVATADFEKVVVGLTVNRCKLTLIDSPTDDQRAKAKVIRWYDEFRW